MKVALLVFASAHLANLVFLLGYALGAVAVRVPIHRVSVLFGPLLKRWRWRGSVSIELRGLPIPGGYVKLTGTEPGEAPAPGSFKALHPLTQAAVTLSGPALTFLFSMALLGPAHAASSLVHAFPQVVAGLSPSSAKDMVLEFGRFGASNPWTELMGVTAAKITAFNLLPVTVLSGGQALLCLLRPSPRVSERLHLLSLVVCLPLALSWFVAVLRAVF